MKPPTLLSTAVAAVALACAAGAQQLFGPWVHDVSSPSTQLSLFVSTTGNDANSGLSPANALQTLGAAVQLADRLLSTRFPTVGAGATINVKPGTYTLPASLKLPAFGLSIEAYWNAPWSPVIVRGPFGNGDPTFYFDRVVGPLTEAALGFPHGLPPSIVRGLTFQDNQSGPAIEIDPSLNASVSTGGRPIEVQVNQCKFHETHRGIRIRNANASPIEYRNVIVDNDFAGCPIGIDVANRWNESDLIRSNRIVGGLSAMAFDGSNAGTGMLHPRIFSNTTTQSTLLAGISLIDCSARIVNNTLDRVTSPCCTTETATIRVATDAGGSAGELVLIANNILNSPPYNHGVAVNPAEIRFVGAAFAGTLVVESNDYDGTGALIAPPATLPTSNIPVADFAFVDPAAVPPDLHLTATSPSITHSGDQLWVLPPITIFLPNGQNVPANCALDVDLDPRTLSAADAGSQLHRGSDQFVFPTIRLQTTSVTNPAPDAIGNVPVDAAGNAAIDLLLEAPAGTLYAVYLGAALPMGPELQHIDVPSYGSIAIDPSPGLATTVLSGQTTAEPELLLLNLNQVSPAFTEAEMYLQAVLLLPGGGLTFTNRIRLDIDGI